MKTSRYYHPVLHLTMALLVTLSAASCKTKPAPAVEPEAGPAFLAPPLVTDLYTADPSAHVFGDRIYIYPSHDIDAGIPENDNGDHFDMK